LGLRGESEGRRRGARGRASRAPPPSFFVGAPQTRAERTKHTPLRRVCVLRVRPRIRQTRLSFLNETHMHRFGGGAGGWGGGERSGRWRAGGASRRAAAAGARACRVFFGFVLFQFWGWGAPCKGFSCCFFGRGSVQTVGIGLSFPSKRRRRRRRLIGRSCRGHRGCSLRGGAAVGAKEMGRKTQGHG
jgi:hypothetical protein